MNTNVFEQFLRNTNGKFFTVTFTKLDGNVRVLNGRTGVTKGVSNKSKVPVGKQNDYLTVFDVKANGFRSVNKSTISNIKFAGTELRKV